MRLAVLASGSGSNFQALVDSDDLKKADVKIVCLFCNVPGAKVIERAARAGVPVEILSHKGFQNREEYDKKVLELLAPHKPDLIALAGYMRMLSPAFLRAFPHKILNIHPALLPSFPGVHGIKDAFEAKVKVTGVTVHLVDEGMDTGPIVIQENVPIDPADTLESLEIKIHAVEHQLYPKAIRLFAEGKARVEGNKVILP
ncbi:MAG: phosphoribosylglycinamide formyltransferase [Bdellovibrionota bacterium]